MTVKKISIQQADRKKAVSVFGVDGFCLHCNTVIKEIGCGFNVCFRQEVETSLSLKKLSKVMLTAEKMMSCDGTRQKKIASQ